ncbi:uncharacterized protein LOC106167206 [Lingula anatina]|uniref:Uncharacterized protein LOC106167206 n=1 Tax=Lingula anatina TaxID=7574 RepID=A0A1S3IT56_LINAN|nr:uncharacterized protein LOC106167206 [Lingula anatina]|eukprot:XP_013401382.1 uncharacterized protein LOC106167206 [Lingula anatina]
MGGVSRLLSFGSLFSLLMILSRISQCDAQNISEFYYRYDGAHIYGGRPYPGTFHNYIDCMRACHNMSSCLATDWDGIIRSCWFHDAETACGVLMPRPSSISLGKKTACVGDQPLQFYYRYNGYHIKGGEQYLGTFDSSVSCTRLCDGIPSCLATDWNQNSKTCWLHTSLTGCGELMPKQNCISFMKESACPNRNTTADSVLILH